MKPNFAVLLGTTALLSIMMMVPVTGTAMAQNYDGDSTASDIQDELDDLREEMEDLREELLEAREERRETLHEARDERRESRHEGREGRHHNRIVINGEEREMTDEERAEFDEEMREFEQEMEEFGREMAELDIEMSGMNFDFDFSDFEHDMSEFGVEMAAFGAEMAGLEGRIMANLEANGLRIESDDNGNETVWISGNSRDSSDADMRVVSAANGDDLVYFYFNGFDEDFSFVMEDGPGNTTIVHAYDTDAVSFETARRHHSNIEAEVDSRGNPVLVIKTDDTDDYEVVRLNRRRFN